MEWKRIMDGFATQLTERSRLGAFDPDSFVFGEVFSDHMFSLVYEDGAWRSPEILPYGPIAVAPGVMALHYGQMVFEGLKAYRGTDGAIRLFRPDRNAARLRASCRRMCIPEIDEALFVAAVEELVRIDQDWVPHRSGHALYIRPIVFSAEEHLEVRAATAFRMIVMTCPAGQYFETGGAGLSLKVEDRFARTAPHGGVGEAKTSANYGTTFLANSQARAEGFDQVLWLDGGEHRYVEEAGLMNIFFKIDGRVVTPALDGAILPGVTRDSAAALIRERGIPVEERQIAIDEVGDAAARGALEEIFVTGTAAVVQPVGRLHLRGGDLVPTHRGDGPLTAWLHDELTGIQYGRRADTRGWTRVVVPAPGIARTA